VDQVGVACHTGTRSCFTDILEPPGALVEVAAEPGGAGR
jgi:hypothetical protein